MKTKSAPIIILDYKYYPWIVKKGLELTKKLDKVADESGINLMICPPLPHLSEYKNEFTLPIISQKVDFLDDKNQSGLLTPELLKEMNIFGVLINQNMYETSIEGLERKIRESRNFALQTIVFSDNVAITAAISKLDPHMIAFVPYYDSTNRQELENVKSQLVENHIKRINIENPRVKKVMRTDIHSLTEIKKLVKLGLDGVLIDVKALQKKNEDQLLDIFKQVFS
ncbi:MAG: triose-phosphate isomerase [Candidatus Hodarchaeales archaeon]